MRKVKLSDDQLKSVIEQRLAMQNTQRRLGELGVTDLSLKKIMSRPFLNHFSSWDNEKKKDFIFLIGGRTNIQRTFYFLYQTEKGLNQE